MAPPPKKTPAVPTQVNLRVRVRTRGKRMLDGADVKITVGATVKTAKTGADGFVKFTVTAAELAAASPPGSVTIEAKKHHHAPDNGPGLPVNAGVVTVATKADTATGFDPGTPLLAKDGSGAFVDVVLIDCGHRFALASLKITRRMTDDEVQKELLFHHWTGGVTLNAASEFVFEHDTTMGEFDPCDPGRCKMKRPKADRRVSLLDPVISGVTFFVLLGFSPSSAQKTDLIPGQRFLRDKFEWGTIPLHTLDQRHVVGLVRLCTKLYTEHHIRAIFTQGVNGDTSRADCHGHGLALDFGGLSRELPDPKVKNMPVRLGVDFNVFLHWGNHPMWDSTTVAASPTTPASWSRLKVNDDGFNYGSDPTGATHRLHYRLDPPPFQDQVPPTVPPLSTDLLKVAPHFTTARDLFKIVYDFAAAEYSDGNPTLGALPPGVTETATPIDSHAGHKILHPDYPHPNTNPSNGRQAHVNHLHFQLGPTHYTSPRTT